MTQIAQKAIIPTHHSNLGNIKWNFADMITKEEDILWNLAKSFSLLKHLTGLNKI